MFLVFVFLGVARRLELSPCNTGTRSHAPGQQSGDHPVPAHTERHNPKLWMQRRARSPLGWGGHRKVCMWSSIRLSYVGDSGGFGCMPRGTLWRRCELMIIQVRQPTTEIHSLHASFCVLGVMRSTVCGPGKAPWLETTLAAGIKYAPRVPEMIKPHHLELYIFQCDPIWNNRRL